MISRYLCFAATLGFSLVSNANQAPLILTGKLSSSNVQSVTAPRTDRWQIQVQWMIDEGSLVSPGDVITVFDSGSVDTQLEQNEDNLATQQLSLKTETMTLDQAVRDAEAALNVADLEVEKARIEASIQTNDISEYDKGQYKLTLERALVEQFKAQQTLQQKQAERASSLEKAQIEIVKLEETVEYQRYLLTRLQVKAQISGVVSHMYHPWDNEKITAGTTLQAAMKVMEVQDISGFNIDAWVHEIDADRITKGQSATITLDAYPQQQFNATVTSIVSQPAKKSGWGESAYYQLQLAFDALPQLKLLPGMSVRVVFANQDRLMDSRRETASAN